MAGQDIWPVGKPATARRVALVVVIAFVLAGGAWILSTDLLLYRVIHDRATIARIETAKGWAFVALTALLLYAVALRAAAQLAKVSRTLSAVLESIGDGVLLLGSDRTIAYANPMSVQMLCGGNLDELRGISASEFSRRFNVSYPDGRLVPPDQFVSQRVYDEAGPLRYTAILHPPGRSELIAHCTAAAVRSESEEPADLVVSIIHDVTANEQLERHRDELFTAVAHAIKTPVAVIKSAAQVLAASESPPIDRSIAMIERQCARIDRLVENLLTLSRIRSGTLRLYPADIELGPVVEAVAGEVARLANGHRIDVHVDARPHVRADRERLAMVLRNAIHGAVRLSRPGWPITVRLEHDPGRDVEVDVSYQARPTPVGDAPVHDVDDEFDDIGVGRYVTAAIVEAHGGTVTQEKEGDNTTMRIMLRATFGDAV